MLKFESPTKQFRKLAGTHLLTEPPFAHSEGKESQRYTVRRSLPEDAQWASVISALIEEGQKHRGIGRGRRPEDYLAQKLASGMAIVALDQKGMVIGFCYLETYEQARFVAHGGLIVSPEWRNSHLGRQLKESLFSLSRELYPQATIFGITTNGAVMKINHSLGYSAVPFSEIPQGDEFWAGCKSCPKFSVLESNARKFCLCTAMAFKPQEK